MHTSRTALFLLPLGLAAGACMQGPSDAPRDDAPYDDELGVTTQAAICGSTNELQHVEQYDGTLGPSVGFVDAHQGAVGRLSNGCSGTMISYNLFLTAGHCIANTATATNLDVIFNYQLDASGNPRTSERVDVVQLVERVNDSSRDYAILRLSGSPGFTWGISELRGTKPVVDEALTIIGHPADPPVTTSGYKVVDGGSVSSVDDTNLHYDDIDTEGGTSGAGVLDARGRVLGVHHGGDCDSGGDNWATSVSRIIELGSMIGGSDNIWVGTSSDSFDSSLSIENAGGTYVAVGGDFDGNGRGDVLWYGRGGSQDHVWFGTGSVAFTNVDVDVAGGNYEPLVGDFDGDGRDDIFWWGRGGSYDSVWYGNANRTFTHKEFSVSGSSYIPVVGDFDNDSRDDIFWYRRGTGADSAWYGSAGRTFTSKAFEVNGDYRPVAGDFNADGRSDIFWYGPGDTSDVMWYGANGRSFTSSSSFSVSGHYSPFAGDFDGDGRSDIFWYGPGAANDFVWHSNGTAFTSTSVDVDGLYTPITGRFDGTNARTDIIWYRPG